MFNFEFIIEGERKTLLPPYTGHLLRGAILKTIAEADEVFAEELHKNNKIRPFSLSPLMPYQNRFHRTNRGEIKVAENSKFQFRLGILTQPLAGRMVNITLANEQMSMKLAEGVFKILSINIKKTTLKELLNQEVKPPTKMQLVFKTPTYLPIRKQKFPMRFPDPRYVFTNLARLWNAFYSQEVLIDEEEFYEWLTAHISISGYRLATRTAFISKGAPVIGFKGWVNYNLSGEEKGYIKWIDALARFAEYSNLGGGRTAGFGCVKYNPKKLINKTEEEIQWKKRDSKR